MIREHIFLKENVTRSETFFFFKVIKSITFLAIRISNEYALPASRRKLVTVMILIMGVA